MSEIQILLWKIFHLQYYNFAEYHFSLIEMRKSQLLKIFILIIFIKQTLQEVVNSDLLKNIPKENIINDLPPIFEDNEF